MQILLIIIIPHYNCHSLAFTTNVYYGHSFLTIAVNTCEYGFSFVRSSSDSLNPCGDRIAGTWKVSPQSLKILRHLCHQKHTVHGFLMMCIYFSQVHTAKPKSLAQGHTFVLSFLPLAAELPNRSSTTLLIIKDLYPTAKISTSRNSSHLMLLLLSISIHHT